MMDFYPKSYIFTEFNLNNGKFYNQIILVSSGKKIASIQRYSKTHYFLRKEKVFEI